MVHATDTDSQESLPKMCVTDSVDTVDISSPLNCTSPPETGQNVKVTQSTDLSHSPGLLL